MSTIQSGDTISVDYTGKFQNGTIFDRSEGQSPRAAVIPAAATETVDKQKK